MAPKRKRNGETATVESSKSKKPKRTKNDSKNHVTRSQLVASSLDGQGNEKSKPKYSCWLVKSEPETRMEKGMDMKFSFDDLKASTDGTACWDGVRNYQARNFLRDEMKAGHDVFFYHSNCKEPGIVGLCKVVKEGYPDHTQFDSKDPHYDSSSQRDNPRWFMVDVKHVRPLQRFISLVELKKIHQAHLANGGPLKNLSLFTKARLSVQPLTLEEFDFILTLETGDSSS